MTQTRKHRTNCFREQVKREWSEHFWKFIDFHLGEPINWWNLSESSNITFDMVLVHPELPWDWRHLSWNPNITFENVLAHPEKSWN